MANRKLVSLGFVTLSTIQGFTDTALPTLFGLRPWPHLKRWPMSNMLLVLTTENRNPVTRCILPEIDNRTLHDRFVMIETLPILTSPVSPSTLSEKL